MYKIICKCTNILGSYVTCSIFWDVNMLKYIHCIRVMHIQHLNMFRMPLLCCRESSQMLSKYCSPTPINAYSVICMEPIKLGCWCIRGDFLPIACFRLQITSCYLGSVALMIDLVPNDGHSLLGHTCCTCKLYH